MKQQLFVFIFTSMLLFGCNQTVQNKIPTYSNIQEAIKGGLQQEGVTNNAIISQKEIDNNVFIFYLENDALGVGTINTKNKNYMWYRGQQYMNIENNGNSSPFLEGTIETQDKKKYQIIVGKINDNSTKEVVVTENMNRSIVPVDKKSRIFYYIKSDKKGTVDVKKK